MKQKISDLQVGLHEAERCRYIQLYCVLFSFCFLSSSGESSEMNHTTPANSLDSTIRYHAFKALTRGHTGIVYDVPLPANLSGVTAAVVRMRSRTLWLEGVRLRSFLIPPRTISIPLVRRLIIVYQNLGNWSTTYYKVQNYSLATPLIGLLAYDANATFNKLDFNVRGDHIIAKFIKINSTRAKCVTFGSSGSQYLDNVTAMSNCLADNGGHFAIVIPREEAVAPAPAMGMENEKRRKWVVWVIGVGSGIVGLGVLCLAGTAIARVVKRRRMEEMGRKAEEGEVLETVWVSGSKMPSATMSRTQPVLEEGSAP